VYAGVRKLGVGVVCGVKRGASVDTRVSDCLCIGNLRLGGYSVFDVGYRVGHYIYRQLPGCSSASPGGLSRKASALS
jgi:hypothetical protein